MNKLNLKKIIKEEILMVLKEDNLGAYRRLVIKTDFKKAIEIKSEINKFMTRPEIKKDYPVTFKLSSGLDDGTIVIDLDGPSTTALVAKLGDLAKKYDKQAVIKIKKERPLRSNT